MIPSLNWSWEKNLGLRKGIHWCQPFQRAHARQKLTKLLQKIFGCGRHGDRLSNWIEDQSHRQAHVNFARSSGHYSFSGKMEESETPYQATQKTDRPTTESLWDFYLVPRGWCYLGRVRCGALLEEAHQWKVIASHYFFFCSLFYASWWRCGLSASSSCCHACCLMSCLPTKRDSQLSGAIS